MSAALREALGLLPGLLAGHVLLSAAALAAAIVIGLPLALVCVRRRLLRSPVLGAVGLIQTIPSLALLALFYPLLLAIGRGTGWPVPALGFLPAWLALTFYALLPIVRNGVAALVGIDAGVIEAADGVGMTPAERLRLVELPLAAPVIMAGIRTAAVWTIGAATLATTVGQACLGTFIFSGLQTENWVAVLVGCGAAAALAIVTDALLALIERGLARRQRLPIVAGAALLLIGTAAALAPMLAAIGGQPRVVIGAKNFSEQYILARVIGDRLHAAGYRTQERDDLGSTVAYRALAAGDIDVYVDYSGTLWANILRRHDNPPAAQLRAELGSALAKRDGVRLLGNLGFENAYTLAMGRSRADALDIRTIGDLAQHAPTLRLASDLEFLSRPEWRAIQQAYDLRFAGAKSYNPTFMYRAVADGAADVLSAFSSDGRIAALDLVTLADTRHALPSYDAVILLSPQRSHDARFIAALRPLIGSIGVARMRAANLLVDRDADKKTPAEAAHWLERAH